MNRWWLLLALVASGCTLKTGGDATARDSAEPVDTGDTGGDTDDTGGDTDDTGGDTGDTGAPDACAAAVPCPGGYDIQSQSGLDDLSQCASIGGDLVIAAQSWVGTIDLPCLTGVEGNLWLIDNSALANLDGLSKLASVGDWLLMDNLDALTSTDGLSSLTSVGGDLTIRNNDSFTDLNGLSSLATVGDSLWIKSNDALANIDGLSSLAHVGGFLSVGSNPSLANINGLSNLTAVGGDLWIEGNANLANLEGLSNLATVVGYPNSFYDDLNITGNASLCQSLVDAFFALFPSNSTNSSGNDEGC
jgi:hypothetical protein